MKKFAPYFAIFALVAGIILYATGTKVHWSINLLLSIPFVVMVGQKSGEKL